MAVIKSSPTYDIPVTPADPVFGSAEAPFSIIFFSDFQCPACAKTERMLKDIVRRNPKVLKLVYKNYPLSKECNESIVASGDLHPKACQAARAAYAAYMLKGSPGFWAYGDLLFEHQKQLKKNPWTKYAEKLNLNLKKFDELMKPDSPAAKKVAEDVSLGLGLQLSGTPKLFFEGKLIPEKVLGGYFTDVLEELIKSKHPERRDLMLKRL
jgi:protein-disulfide isomerase